MSDELPEGWATARLGDLCQKPQYGWTTSAKKASSGVRLLRTTDISGGAINWAAVPFCDEAPPDLDKYLLRDGDIVVSRAGSVGISHRVTGAIPKAVFASYLIRFHPIPPISGQFIRLFLDSPSYWDAVQEESAGIALQNINASKLADMVVPVPPLAEQHRIVAKVEELLDEVNRAKARLTKVQAILKRFRQSVLAAACSGELTRGWSGVAAQEVPEDSLPAGWAWASMSDLATAAPGAICAGPFGTIFKAHDFRDQGVPIIFLRHVAAGEYRTTKPGFMDPRKWEELFKPYSVWGGELLVTKLGDPPGTCAIYPQGIGPAMVTPDVIKMTVEEKRASARYLMHYLNSEPARQRAFGIAYGATRPRMNLDIFRSLQVPLPGLDEQAEIVRRVDALFALADAIDRRLVAAISKAEKLPQAILSKAFSGDLVPTEAELARLDGRDYDPASVLLARVKGEAATGAVAKKKRATKRQQGVSA